jgi:hypothetical protein
MLLDKIQNFYRSTRNYEIVGNDLIITKLFNLVRIPIDDITFIQVPRDIYSGLVKIEGTKDYFQNDEISKFQAFVTDWNKVIFLKVNGQFIAISPSDTEEFIERLSYKL